MEEEEEAILALRLTITASLYNDSLGQWNWRKYLTTTLIVSRINNHGPTWKRSFPFFSFGGLGDDLHPFTKQNQFGWANFFDFHVNSTELPMPTIRWRVRYSGEMLDEATELLLFQWRFDNFAWCMVSGTVCKMTLNYSDQNDHGSSNQCNIH